MDNETPSDRLGYRFEYVDGTMPEGLTIFPMAYSLSPTNELYLTWDDGADWSQEEFCFRVAVRAIDQAGNESARSNVLIVGHDGDMEYVKRVAEAQYSKASMRLAKEAARVHLTMENTTVVDSVRVQASRPGTKPPSTIGAVYEETTVGLINKIDDIRMDRVAFRPEKGDHDIRYEGPYGDPYILVESGRSLSKDELFQLRSLLMDPHSYIGDKWMCSFHTSYAFSAGPDGERAYILAGEPCYTVSIHGPGVRQGADLTREAASILRSFCEGLFRLELLE